MAYNANNETKVNVVDIKKNNRGDYLKMDVVTKNSNGDKAVDIRNYYTTEDGEIRPTQRGVRIKSEEAYDITLHMLDILEANELMDLVDEINQRLGVAGSEDAGSENDSEDEFHGMTQQSDD